MITSHPLPTVSYRKAFVTGGSGFLGRRLVQYLKAISVEVKALARSPETAKLLEKLGATPVHGDLSLLDALSSGMSGCEVVFHAAGKVDMWGPLEEFMKVNVEGTRNVLLAAKNAKCRRVVHVSTEAVLVGNAIVNADETMKYSPNIRGNYPKSKAIAEQVALAVNGPELEVVVVRPRLIWGRDDTVVLKQIVEQCKSGNFKWIGGGANLTSTCHVQNVCEGLVLAAERGRPGEIYFVTDGPPTTVRKFLEPLLQAKGINTSEIGNLPTGVARTAAWFAEVYILSCIAQQQLQLQLHDAAWSVLPLKGSPPAVPFILDLLADTVTINDEKARRELGYKGMVTYEEGLKEILEEETAQKARLAQLKVAAVAMNREGSGSRRVSSNRNNSEQSSESK